MSLFNKKDGLQNVHDNITQTFINLLPQTKTNKILLISRYYNRSIARS